MTVLVLMLLETELMMAVALAMPCLVRLLGLAGRCEEEEEELAAVAAVVVVATGDREDLVVPDLTDKACRPTSVVC